LAITADKTLKLQKMWGQQGGSREEGIACDTLKHSAVASQA